MKPDIKGLEKLAAHLRTVPTKDFDMAEWILDTPCGTSACIAGHAALLFPTRFRKKVVSKDDGYINYSVVHRQSGISGSEGFSRAFHLTLEDAEDLTMWSFYLTPKHAAAGITKLVKKLKLEMVGKK